MVDPVRASQVKTLRAIPLDTQANPKRSRPGNLQKFARMSWGEYERSGIERGGKGGVVGAECRNLDQQMETRQYTLYRGVTCLAH